MENNRNRPGQNPGGDPNKNNAGGDKKGKGFLLPLLISLAMLLAFMLIYDAIDSSKYKEVTYTEFLAAKDAGQLGQVHIHSDRIIYYTVEEMEKDARERKACMTGLPFGDVMALAEKLASEGKSVIMISSELAEIQRLSDRVIVMCEGRITGELDIADATQEEIMKYATMRD